MAYGYVQKIANQDLTGTSAGTIATAAMTVSAGSTIIVVIFFFGADTTCTITDTLGNTYTQRGPEINDGGSSRVRRYSTVSVGSGSNAVTATFGATRAYRCVSAEEYTGVGAFSVASGQLQVSPGLNADALTSTNATPGGQPALQWGVCHRIELENFPPNAGTGFNSRAVMWNEGRTEDRRLTSTSATSATFTAPDVGTGSYLVGQLIFLETAEGAAGMIKRERGMTGGMSTMSGGMRG